VAHRRTVRQVSPTSDRREPRTFFDVTTRSVIGCLAVVDAELELRAGAAARMDALPGSTVTRNVT
jgi:hypothetical protein